jgi:Domain of unknown function (DUF4402)
LNYRNILIAAGLVAAASAPAAAAPVNASSSSKALILVPLTLTKVDDLDFGTMVAPPAPGTVALDAATSARTYTGGVVGVASAPGHRGYFGGAGTPNQQVILTLVPPAQLTDTNGDTIGVLALTLDNSGNPIRTVDATTRTFFVGVGGVLSLTANQPDGDYSATFQLLANYQ